jgi:predicted nucleic acid-binding Zn ribbon protein
MSPPARRRRPPAADRGPRPLSEGLGEAVARLDTDAATLGTVFSRWEEIAGTDLARHVQPLKLSAGVLWVAADHAAWATQVRALGTTLLERVGTVAGAAPSRLEVTVRRPGGGRRNAPGSPPVE